MEDQHALLQEFSRLNIGKGQQTNQGDGPKAASDESARLSRTSVKDHAFQPKLQCPDLCDKFVTLRLHAEKENEVHNERTPLVRRRSSIETLPARNRTYPINGLAGQHDSAHSRREWLDSRTRNNNSPSDAGPSSPLSSENVEAQVRWESSRRKRHSMSGYPSKEQYWARKISKAEIGIQNLRKSHREAQRMAKRKGKTLEVDLNDANDSEDEML